MRLYKPCDDFSLIITAIIIMGLVFLMTACVPVLL